MQELKALSIREISAKILGSSYRSHELEALVKDEKIETPTPTIRFNNQDYWNENQIEDWKKLVVDLKAIEEYRKALGLVQESITKAELVKALVDDSTVLARRNSHCYQHSRNNSLTDGRLRVLRFQGKMEFVRELLEPLVIPAEQMSEILDNIHKAKASVNMEDK